jgi:hypothetical protein
VLAFVCGDIRGATQLPHGTHFITYADSLYAKGHPQVARAPAPQVSPRPPSPVAAQSTVAVPAGSNAAPGIGEANWKNLAHFDDLAYFVLPANLKPGGRTGRGWFLVLYRDPQGATSGGRIAQAAIAQQFWTADCAHNTIALLQVSYFSAAGASLGAEVVPSPERQSVDPSGNTIAAAMLSLLCARPYELDELDYTADAATLRKIFWLPANPQPTAPAQVAAGPSASAPAATAPGGRPSVNPMSIGPAMCPLLRRLETLAHEDFRSIDLGPDRRAGKSAELFHRTSMQMPPADCWISIDPKMPEAYNCLWPTGKEKEVDDQFVNLGRALEQCMGGKLDLSMLEIGYVSVKVRGVEFGASVANDSVSLDVRMAKP